MIDFDAQAVAAGRTARRVLDGEDPNSLAIRGQELNRPLVHWQRLQHWNVPESNVPSHVTILHREPTLWESYRWLIVATFAIFILQFGLIVALLLNRLQRRRAERALLASQDVARRQRDDLARVNRVTTVGELATSRTKSTSRCRPSSATLRRPCGFWGNRSPIPRRSPPPCRTLPTMEIIATAYMVKYIKGPPTRTTGAVNMIRPDGTQPAPMGFTGPALSGSVGLEH